MKTPKYNAKNIKGRKKVAVGLSGGVDSAVAALLLLEEGFDVTGVHIKCWDARVDGCKSDEDRSFAVKTAATLGINIVHLDFVKQYKDKVIEYFYSEYISGRTPNPDIMCNKEIKFGLFYKWVIDNGFDYLATGHYARILPFNNDLTDPKVADDSLYDLGFYKDSVKYLCKGSDPEKDQSYFLCALNAEHLEKTIFPVGDLKKKEVRKLAVEYNLPPATRPDSTGICFIGEVDIKTFLKKQVSIKQGDVIDKNGEIIGKHEGVWFYTIGQRHGFEISKYQGKPSYVIRKDLEQNTLIVGSEEDAMFSSFQTKTPYWIYENPFSYVDELYTGVRIRHLGKVVNGLVTKLKDGHLKVELKEKVFGVAPGQSAVFYDGAIVIGSAVIS